MFSNYDCSICKNEENKFYVKLNPCGHYFHSECIKRWECEQNENGVRTTCPMCRGYIETIKDSMKCSTCFHETNNGDIFYLHPCGHLFHDCRLIQSWLNEWPEMDTCPICINEIKLRHDYTQYRTYSRPKSY